MTTQETIDIQIRHHRTSLAERCRALSAHILKLAEKLESATPHDRLNINELGEIQSEGTMVDAKCGLLMGKINVWSMIKDDESL